MDSQHSTDLYPHIEPFAQGRLDVGDGHSLYWDVSGNPRGVPVVVVHGGPGAGTVASQRRFFDPGFYRIVLFDQRGAGRSRPKASTAANTTQHLIADMEQLRAALDIEQWLLFGGSWGATLALAYGQAHPERALGFVLRGVFMGTSGEIDWFLHDMNKFFPDAHRTFVDHVKQAGKTHERNHLLGAYLKLLNNPDPEVHMPAARTWALYENACSTLLPARQPQAGAALDSYALSLARIEAHYFASAMFLEPGQLMGGVGRISHLPAKVVQGRYDVICPIAAAEALVRAWPGAQLEVVADAGHSAMEPGIRRALTTATDDFRDLIKPAG